MYPHAMTSRRSRGPLTRLLCGVVLFGLLLASVGSVDQGYAEANATHRSWLPQLTEPLGVRGDTSLPRPPAAFDPSKGHPYPRVGVMNWGGAPADWYARFDLAQVRSLPIEEIRKANPYFIYLPTRDLNLACDGFVSCPEEWYLHDSQGNRISAGDYAAGHWANLSDMPQGASNGQRLVDALPEIFKQLIESSGSDGIATDGLYYRLHYSWANYRNLWPDVDLDRNGLNDRTEPGKGDAWVLEHWARGVDSLLTEIERMLDSLPPNPNPMLPRYGFLVNTGSSGSDLLDSPGATAINGFLWEHTGADYGWRGEEDVAGRQPPLFLDNNYATGPWSGPPKDAFRAMRFGLTRAMLRGDYFDFQDNNAGGDNHYWDRYYDEFDLNVGYPTSGNQQLPGRRGVWVKFFDGGVAVANINHTAVTVTDSDLRGLSGYDGPYWRFQGGQDPLMNSGEPFTSVELLGFTDSYAGGISGDGIILVDTPQTVIADIIIDNTDSGTSPASSPAEFSGAWQEGCGELGSRFYTLRCAEWFDSYGMSITSDPNAFAVFRPTIGVTGEYEVYEWHGVPSQGAAATNVRYAIAHADGTADPIVNQRANPGQWNSLGKYRFDGGSQGNITVSASGANGVVMADAIKLVYRGHEAPTSFVDVPASHWAYTYIEALFQGGFVAGCQTSPRRYCAESGMTRGEAAVFVERGLHGGGFLPPQPPLATFSDVPLAEWFAKWAEGLWKDGYTAGCQAAPLLFCPLTVHNRAEATVFFERMLHGKDFIPTETGEPPYSDVARGTWYMKWVAAAKGDGLTEPCEAPGERGDGRFRPMEPLTRAEAACMMARAKGLPLP